MSISIRWGALLSEYVEHANKTQIHFYNALYPRDSIFPDCLGQPGPVAGQLSPLMSNYPSNAPGALHPL